MKTYIFPPFGYKWNTKEPLDADDVEAMRSVVLAQADWPDAARAKIMKEDKKGLQKFFRDNGFEFVKENQS